MIASRPAYDPCHPNENQPQAFDGIIRKRSFLSTEAAELEERQPGAAGAILATPEERLIEKNAHTEGEESRPGRDKFLMAFFEHLDQAMSEASPTPDF